MTTIERLAMTTIERLAMTTIERPAMTVRDGWAQAKCDRPAADA